MGDGWQDVELCVELTRKEARRGRWFCAVLRMGWTGGIVAFLFLAMGALGYAGVAAARLMGWVDWPIMEGELGERVMHLVWSLGIFLVLVGVGVRAVVWRSRGMVVGRDSYRVRVTSGSLELRWEGGERVVPWRLFTAFEETGDLWVLTTQSEYVVIPVRAVRAEDVLRLRIFFGWKTGIERPEVAHGFPVEVGRGEGSKGER